MTTALGGRHGAIRGSVVLLAALALVGFNLRTPIAAVPPILDDIRAQVGLSAAAAGALVALPVLCFSAGAPFGPALGRRLGELRALTACVLVVAAGNLLRAVPGAPALFAGTVVTAGAIAIAGVLLPSVIKDLNPSRAGALTGVYTMLLVVGTALASGLTVPLERAFGNDVHPALAIWALPALAAGILLAARGGGRPQRRGPNERFAARWIWRDRVAWQVTGFLTFESIAFYSLLSWLPSIARDHGVSPGSAGAALSAFILVQIPSSLAVPVLAERRRSQRGLILAITVVSAVGITGLLLSPTEPLLLWPIILGIGQGGAFGLAFTLIVLRASDGSTATELSGMAQTTAYLLAAGGPFALAVLHDATGGWTAPLIAIVGVLAGQLAMGLFAGRDRLVTPPQQQQSGGPPSHGPDPAPRAHR